VDRVSKLKVLRLRHCIYTFADVVGKISEIRTSSELDLVGLLQFPDFKPKRICFDRATDTSSTTWQTLVKLPGIDTLIFEIDRAIMLEPGIPRVSTLLVHIRVFE